MRGLTVLEVLIVLGILAVIATFLVGALVEFRTTSAVVEAKSEIIGILRDARVRTLASRNNTNYGVHFEETKVVLFDSDTYNPLAPNNETYQLYSSRIAAIALGGPLDVVFERLSGIASANGTIVLTATNNSSKTETITILATGVIQ